MTPGDPGQPTGRPTFDPSHFAALREVERNHFWFRARRAWILDRLSLEVASGAAVLEVGCGTGNVASHLARAGYRVTGTEPFAEALQRAWPGFDRVQASVGALPFKRGAFAVVCMFDVLEHLDDELAALAEVCRVARAGALVALTVPADMRLWSWMDELAHHRRRYSREALVDVLCRAGLEPVRVEYMFMGLRLPMVLSRRKRSSADSQLRIVPGVNGAFRALFALEATLGRLRPLPTGTSLLALARVRGG